MDPILPSTQDEKFDEHDILPLELDILLPFSYAGLSASNEFVVQESNQQLKEGFVSLKCNETYAVNELLQGG